MLLDSSPKCNERAASNTLPPREKHGRPKQAKHMSILKQWITDTSLGKYRNIMKCLSVFSPNIKESITGCFQHILFLGFFCTQFTFQSDPWRHHIYSHLYKVKEQSTCKQQQHEVQPAHSLHGRPPTDAHTVQHSVFTAPPLTVRNDQQTLQSFSFRRNKHDNQLKSVKLEKKEEICSCLYLRSSKF